MNLEQSLSMQNLQTPIIQGQPKQKMSAQRMAERVFQLAAQAGHPFENITAEQWAEKWLSSPEFVLTEVETERIALLRTPRNTNQVIRNMQAQKESIEPVVVDLNKQNLALRIGYSPSIIAVDGAHRCYGQYLVGRERIRAWVGTQALARMAAAQVPKSVQASGVKRFVRTDGTKISSSALLYAAQGRPQPPRQDAGDGGPSPTMAMPTVKSGVPDGSDFIKNRGVVKKRNAVDGAFMPVKPTAGGDGGGGGFGGFKGGPTAPIASPVRSAPFGGGKSGPTGTPMRPVAGLRSAKAHKAGCLCAECKKKMSAHGGTGGPGGATSGANPDNPYSAAGKKMKAGGPGSGRHKVGDQVKPVGGDRIKHVIDVRYDDRKTGEYDTQPVYPQHFIKVGNSPDADPAKTTWSRAQDYVKASEVKASRRTPEARSTGQLDEPDPSDEKVPPDPSDAGQSTDPSDRQQYKQSPQTLTPGYRKDSGTGGNPAMYSPGSGVGPRMKPNKGASKSELQRTMSAKAKKDCVDCGTMDAGPIKVKKITTKKKKKNMKFVAPPGWSEETMHKLKRKHGTESAFKIAWSAYKKNSK